MVCFGSLVACICSDDGGRAGDAGVKQLESAELRLGWQPLEKAVACSCMKNGIG